MTDIIFNNSIMYVTDSNNNCIRAISSVGSTTRYSGSTTAGQLNTDLLQSEFNAPSGLAIASNGDIYVADTGNYVIRKISNGTVTLFAGTFLTPGPDNGKPGRFLDPTGLLFDDCGNLFVIDSHMIRMVNPQGEVSTIAGKPVSGSDNGNGTDATFFRPMYMARNGTDIFVADSSNHVIRKLAFQ